MDDHIAGVLSYYLTLHVGEVVLEVDLSLELMRELVWRAMLVSAPVLLAALAVGVLISVLQVATQLQEMTLSYIPKLLVTALVLTGLGGWMIHQITQFAVHVIKLIPSLG